MDDAYKKLIDIAYNLHVSGKLDEAKFTYEKLLASNPDDIEVKNLYAQLNVALKNYDLALSLFKDIYEKTNLSEILINIAKVYFFKKDYENVIKTLKQYEITETAALRILALAYTKNNQPDEAIEIYNKIISGNEFICSDYYNLSLIYSDKGDIDNSLKYALTAHKLNQKDLNINLHIASIYDNASDYKNALPYLLEVSKVKPDIDIFYRIGVIYKKLRNDDAAVQYFNAILNVDPDNKNALLNLANIFRNHDKNVSVEIYKKLLNKYPNDYDILLQLCLVQTDMLDYTGVLETAEKLLKLNPNEEVTYSFIGDSLCSLSKYESAIEYYKKSKQLSSNPQYVDLQIAYIYAVIGKHSEAKEILNKYLDKRTAQIDYAFLCCKERNIEPVRSYMYEHLTTIKTADDALKKANSNLYRLQLDKKYGITEDIFLMLKNQASDDISGRLLQYQKKDFFGKNKEIKDKRVLLYSADGVGDLIMFSRYIPIVQKLAKHIILQVPKSCVSLFKYNFPDIEIISDDYAVNDDLYDFSSSIFCLICNFDISLKNIPSSSGYLSVNEDIIKEKHKILNTEKKKIGVFWQGNPVLMSKRSIKLEKLRPLFDLNNIQIFSFQISKIDFASEELKKTLPIVDIAPYIKSYEDTAAFLKNIDILISIDTSIANLAGALGVKTYLLLPYEAEWRWFDCTNTTPWYDSIKIFKQIEPENWDEVIQRVKNEL